MDDPTTEPIDAGPARPLAAVLDLLRQMSMEVHAYLTDAARDAGLGPVDVACLGIARQAERDGEQLTAGSLGRRLGLSPAATTALLDRMSRHGLIVRDRAAHDGRVVVVRTTAKARVLGRAMFEQLNAHYAHTLTDQGASADALADLLRHLVSATEQAREARGHQHLPPG